MKIGLIINQNKSKAEAVGKQIVRVLTDAGAQVVSTYQTDGVTLCADEEEVIRQCDIAVTVGGDGTIIHNAKSAATYGKPLLGVNLGRIGFVANIEPGEIGELTKLLTGDYRIQKRMLLDITIEGKHERRDFLAVNEATLHRDSLSSMVDISVSLAGERIITYRADGMLFSTPTGSTAYSFSAGGPVIQPDLSCVLLTPVCPHALSSRQVVFGADAVLTARVLPSSDLKCYLTVDGQDHTTVSSDDTVTVRRSSKELQLIILKEKNFYTLLNEKLKEPLV